MKSDNLSRRFFLKSAGLTAASVCMPSILKAAGKRPPNIILIYIDDLGYGDVSCYGATKVSTPNIDRLASRGIRFTNAHCGSATCTPSRYAMLTGEYAWRQRGTGVLPGNARMIISPGRTTLPSILKSAGYKTAVVGKWHLGLGNGNVDWNREIKPGPLEIGFDYCYLIPATGDRVPCVYMENYKVVDLDPSDPIQVSYGKPVGNDPTGKDRPDLLKMHPSHGHNQTIVNGISRIGYMSGGKSARWVDEDMADRITEKALNFIDDNKERPFFLYFSTHDIHVPRVPHPRFVGKSGLGPRGDAIVQMDWCVGQVLDKLEKLDQLDNSIVIFTSDNGPVVDDGYKDDAVEKLNGHKPAGPLRGGKYSAFDGGTRIPFIISWPGKIKPGESDALICQIDLPASFAAFTKYDLKYEDAPDSLNILPALLGKTQTARNYVIEHSRTLSIIKGDWKYITPNNGARINRATNTELGNDPKPQLYNLKEDLGEKSNLAEKYPDKVKELAELLEDLKSKGRSRS